MPEEDESPLPEGSVSTPTASEAPHVDIPAGTFIAGSTPGDRGRDPTLEPAEMEVNMGAFTIDRYLYPNDPQKPPETGIKRDRAEDLCRERGLRLCTELEWEYACKGPDSTAYAGRKRWDPACAEDPTSCASGFGVLGMGIRYREWTASRIDPVDKGGDKLSALRGTTLKSADVDHRCSHRSGADASTKAEDLGFRCCGGAPNAPTIPTPKWEQTFRHVDMDAKAVAELMAAVPQLAAVSEEVKLFDEDKAIDMVLKRADRTERPKGYGLTTSALLWNPAPGEQILVVTGQSKGSSFIAALYKLPNDRYRIGSSLVLKNDPGPVILAHDGSVRRRMRWATCWECNGEWGKITYRDENRVVITQQ